MNKPVPPPEECRCHCTTCQHEPFAGKPCSICKHTHQPPAESKESWKKRLQEMWWGDEDSSYSSIEDFIATELAHARADEREKIAGEIEKLIPTRKDCEVPSEEVHKALLKSRTKIIKQARRIFKSSLLKTP